MQYRRQQKQIQRIALNHEYQIEPATHLDCRCVHVSPGGIWPWQRETSQQDSPAAGVTVPSAVMRDQDGEEIPGWPEFVPREDAHSHSAAGR